MGYRKIQAMKIEMEARMARQAEEAEKKRSEFQEKLTADIESEGRQLEWSEVCEAAARVAMETLGPAPVKNVGRPWLKGREEEVGEGELQAQVLEPLIKQATGM